MLDPNLSREQKRFFSKLRGARKPAKLTKSRVGGPHSQGRVASKGQVNILAASS